MGYSKDEIFQILAIRCEEEDVEIEENAKKFLTEIGIKTSLRYALHLIQPSFCIAKKRKANEISVADIKRVYSLFVDVDRSVQFLNDYQAQFVFHDEEDERESDSDDDDDEKRNKMMQQDKVDDGSDDDDIIDIE